MAERHRMASEDDSQQSGGTRRDRYRAAQEIMLPGLEQEDTRLRIGCNTKKPAICRFFCSAKSPIIERFL